MLREITRLDSFGFSIIWLRPKSKAPFEKGWAKAPRKTWAELINKWDPSYNAGVRLGSASKVGRGFLAVVDIDIKSDLGRYYEEVTAKMAELFPQNQLAFAPTVFSGRGNGSAHVYVLTADPIAGRRLAQSGETVKVAMPSVSPSKREMIQLSKAELDAGLRLRPAWEISLMGEGRQVVLPPSIHPDSGKKYEWSAPFGVEALPLLPPEIAGAAASQTVPRGTDSNWRPVSPARLIELNAMAKVVPIWNLLDEMGDRSAALYRASDVLLREQWSTREIQTFLSDADNELGAAAFGHLGTTDRNRVVAWVTKYAIEAAARKLGAATAFRQEAVIEVLGEEEAEMQKAELVKEGDWQSRLGRSDKGLRASFENICLILTNEVGESLIKRDIFAMRETYGLSTPWGRKVGDLVSDDDVLHIKSWLAGKWKFEPSNDKIHDALVLIASRNEYHPVREYLNSLAEWDGAERLDNFLMEHFEAKGCREYCAQVFRKWLVAAVRRIFEPGFKFDWMPIFEGAQGIGKSSLARILASEKWFIDWLPPMADKDAAFGLAGNWFYEMGELADYRKTELETVKAFLTRQFDKARPPYGRRIIEMPRQCMFLGTTNRSEYLIDDSGNRRFKPVMVGQLDFKYLKANRDQLFAEALFIHRNRLEKHFELEGIAKEYEVQIHADKIVIDPSDLMQEKIENWLENPENKLPEKGFSLTALFEGFGPLVSGTQDMRSLKFAGKALRALGFECRKSNGRKLWIRV